MYSAAGVLDTFMRMVDEWISAAEAHEIISAAIGVGAAKAICRRAHDGLVRAKARTLAIGKRRGEDLPVPSEFWWAGGEAALTQSWATGDFETWIDRKIHCRAYGVSFFLEDINSMVPRRPIPLKAPAESPNASYESSDRCVEELSKSLDLTRSEVTAQIARFGRANLIGSRCSSFWCRFGDGRNAPEIDLNSVEIPTWFWDACALDSHAILDSKSGTFACKGLAGGVVCNIRIKDAEFDISGIIDLEFALRDEIAADDGARMGKVDKAPRNLRRSGGRRKSENWAGWVAELASYIHEEGIPAGEGPEGQDAVIGAIEDRLAAKGMESLGRTTVQPIVRAVLLRLRSAEN